MKGILKLIYTQEIHSNLRITSIKTIKTNNNKIPRIFIIKEFLLEAEYKKKSVFAYNHTICGDDLKL